MNTKYYVALIAPNGKGLAGELMDDFTDMDEAIAVADEWQAEDERTGDTSENRWGVVDNEKKEIYAA